MKVVFSCLQDSLSQTTGIQHKRVKMNPKAICVEEMFGDTDKMSGEWLDGVFATMWSTCNDRNRTDIMWIVFDGPVDAIWIENLNTVFDDNKILTLANGDCILMTYNAKLMFEVEDLRNASPATVSRSGITFVSDSYLDWEPVLMSWLNQKPNHFATIFLKSFGNFVGHCTGNNAYGHLFHFLNLNKHSKLTVQCSRVSMVEGCYQLLDGLLGEADLASTPADLEIELERIFLYSITWGIGGLLEADDRIKLQL